MNDSPPSAFATEDDRTASEPLGVAELERDEHDAGRQWLNAEVDRREVLKGRAASGVSPHIGEHGAERGVDRDAAGHALGHVRRGMEDRGGVGEGSAKRLRVEVFERREEATQHTGDGGRVARSRLARLGTECNGKGEPRERGNDGRRAPEERSQHHEPIPVRRVA